MKSLQELNRALNTNSYTTLEYADQPSHWVNEQGDKITSLPQGTYGFVYLISNQDNDILYIGKKTCVAVTNNNWHETQWRYYKSSSEDMRGLMKRKHHVWTFTVLQYCTNPEQLTDCEIQYQNDHDVLMDLRYVNQNIGGKRFRDKDDVLDARLKFFPDVFSAIL